jgi:single-strand DNA-binding protein
MANFNKVILVGYLTRDPELRYTQDGISVANFGIAVNHEWTTQNGEKKKETAFVDCTVWRKQAEILNQYCKKGSPLLLEGRLKFDSWEKDGQRRSKLSVVVDRFQFLGSKPETKPEATNSAPPPSDVPPEGDEDIPF